MTNEQIEKINAIISEMNNQTPNISRCLYRAEVGVNAASARIKVANMPAPTAQINAETTSYGAVKHNNNNYKTPDVKSTIRGPHRA